MGYLISLGYAKRKDVQSMATCLKRAIALMANTTARLISNMSMRTVCLPNPKMIICLCNSGEKYKRCHGA